MSNLLRPIKRLIKATMGRDLFIRTDCQANYTRLGSEYGGWDLVTEQLDRQSIIYSIGVGQDISFDLALIDETGATIHAFDPTPKSIDWIKTQDLPSSFVMHEYGIADFVGSATFYPPDNSSHVSHTILDRAETNKSAIEVPVKTLSAIMKELRHSKIDLLKMDVEGAEYAIIENIRSTDIRPGQLLVEFHHRFPDVGIDKTRDAVRMIRAMGYGLFAVSKSGEEFSFIYKGR